MTGYAAEPRTLFRKIWDAHLVEPAGDDAALIYIDRHLVHEVTSPQAFDGLRSAGRRVRRPGATLAVADHNVPTEGRGEVIADPDSRAQVETLERNTAEFGVPYIPLLDARQGIVHVVGPELGASLPGMTIVCGDSHTSTHGALGALAFGIGTSEVEHVLATQTLMQARPKTLRITVSGALSPGVSAKDLALAIIARIGAGGGAGFVIEYAGEAVTALGMAGRMTLCNMAIESGARAGLVAPDDVTFEYVRGRPMAPGGAPGGASGGEAFDAAVAAWRTLASDPDAAFDAEVSLAGEEVEPMVTWGTASDAVIPIGGVVPDPEDAPDEAIRADRRRMLDYMGLRAGQPILGTPVDVVFVGSCTNSRIEDIREVARIVQAGLSGSRSVAPHVRALVVPGSGLVKAQAEAEGLDRILVDAGFEWRQAGCSMCLGMNPDRLTPGQRCVSTSNRNFEGRQGPGGRTHLASPATAAASAIAGRIAAAREFG